MKKTTKNATDGSNTLGAENVLSFNKEAANLNAVAEKMFADGNELAAVDLCYECEKNGKLTPSLYACMAESLFNYRLYSRAADCWFKYLNLVTEKSFIRAYNGLGACYQMGEIPQIAAYYYNMQLQSENDRELLYDDYMYDLFYGATNSDDDDGIGEILAKIIDPDYDSDEPDYSLNDCDSDYDSAYGSEYGAEDDYDSSLDFKRKPSPEYEPFTVVDKEPKAKKDEWRNLYYLGRRGIYEKPVTAENVLSFIPEDSPYYVDACYYRAIAALNAKIFDVALELFAMPAVKSKHIDSVAYLFGVKFLLGDWNESDKAAFFTLKGSGCSVFKVLSHFVNDYNSQGEFDKAYELAVIMQEVAPNDAPVFRLVAACAFNAGKYELASEYFYKYYALTRNPCAGYYRDKAQKAMRGEKVDKIEDEKSFPLNEAEKIISKVSKWLIAPTSSLKRRANEIFELAEEFFYIGNVELQSAICQVLFVIGGERAKSFFKKRLIESEVNDGIKLLITSLLVQLGNDKLTGAVFSAIYSRVQFEKVEFPGEKDFIFTEAYALAFGKLAPYYEARLYKIKTAAYEIFNKLCRNGNVNKVTDVLSLATVIAVQSKAVKLNKTDIIEYFNASRSAVKKVEDLIKKTT